MSSRQPASGAGPPTGHAVEARDSCDSASQYVGQAADPVSGTAGTNAVRPANPATSMTILKEHDPNMFGSAHSFVPEHNDGAGDVATLQSGNVHNPYDASTHYSNDEHAISMDLLLNLDALDLKSPPSDLAKGDGAADRLVGVAGDQLSLPQVLRLTQNPEDKESPPSVGPGGNAVVAPAPPPRPSINPVSPSTLDPKAPTSRSTSVPPESPASDTSSTTAATDASTSASPPTNSGGGQPSPRAEPRLSKTNLTRSLQMPRPKPTYENTSLPFTAPDIGSRFIFGSAVDEEESMKQFRLHFQKASLKEKAEKYDEAIYEYGLALIMEIDGRGESNMEIAKTHRVIARVCRKAKQHDRAIEHLNQALEVCIKCGINADSDTLWNTHDDLAQAYSQMGDKDKEIEHYETAIDILVKSTDVPPERLAHMHNNVGVTYHHRKENEKARHHLERAKEMMTLIHLGAENDSMAKVHKGLGDLYMEMGLAQMAMDEFKACLRIYKNNPEKATGRLLSVPVHKSLADIYKMMGNEEKEREHLLASENKLEALTEGEDEESRALLAELARQASRDKAVHADISKAQQYQKENKNVKAIEFYEEAFAKLAEFPEEQKEKEENLAQVALVHNNLGNSYRSVSKLETAKEHMLDALKIRRRLYPNQAHDNTATTLFNLGYIYSQLGGLANLVESIECHKECLDMYLKIGGPRKHMKWIVGLYRSLASNYFNLNESHESIKYYEKARDVINNFGGDLPQLQAIYNNVGNSYKSVKKYKEAEDNLMSALDLATVMSGENPENLELQNDIASVENNLGCMFQEMKDYRKALDHHLKSLKIRERIAPVYAEAATDLPANLHNIGNAYFSSGEYNEALGYYEREEQKRIDLREDTRDVLLTMSRLLEKMGELDKAEQCINRAHMSR